VSPPYLNGIIIYRRNLLPFVVQINVNHVDQHIHNIIRVHTMFMVQGKLVRRTHQTNKQQCNVTILRTGDGFSEAHVEHVYYYY
jgi:hypothetical protein